MGFVALSVCCVYSSDLAGSWVHLHIADKLPTHNFPPLLLDEIHKGQEQQLTHRALTPADVEVVLVRQSCMGTLCNTSSVPLTSMQQHGTSIKLYERALKPL